MYNHVIDFVKTDFKLKTIEGFLIMASPLDLSTGFPLNVVFEIVTVERERQSEDKEIVSLSTEPSPSSANHVYQLADLFQIDEFMCTLFSRYLSIRDVVNYGSINKRLYDLTNVPYLWKQIGQEIDPKNSDLQTKERIIKLFRNTIAQFKELLKSNLSHLENSEKDKLQKMLCSYEIEDLNLLLKIQCSEAQIVSMKSFSEPPLPQDLSLDLKTFKTIAEIFEGANKFISWCEINQNKLSKLICYQFYKLYHPYLIFKIPSQIGLFSSLTRIVIMNGELQDLPIQITCLSNLNVLNLYENKFNEIPEIISKMSNLKSLILSRNQIGCLSSTMISNLMHLSSLQLENNGLTNLPSEFGSLTNLHLLDLSNNKFGSLPAKFCNLTNLMDLKLNNNDLMQGLPTEFSRLINLNWLSLNKNNFQKFPISILSLTNLDGLSLRKNNLNVLPCQIGQLTKLKILSLVGNLIRELPLEFNGLSNLTDCFLHKNPLNELVIKRYSEKGDLSYTISDFKEDECLESSAEDYIPWGDEEWDVFDEERVSGDDAFSEHMETESSSSEGFP